jgi:hypothetical protein
MQAPFEVLRDGQPIAYFVLLVDAERYIKLSCVDASTYEIRQGDELIRKIWTQKAPR